MSFFSVAIFFVSAVVINIIITSFLLSRTYNSKRIVTEIEETIQSLVANIDSATNKQILIAEENIKKLQEEQKNAMTVIKHLKSFRLSRYDDLVSLLDKEQKKKQKVAKQGKKKPSKALPVRDSHSEENLSRDEIELRKFIKTS